MRDILVVARQDSLFEWRERDELDGDWPRVKPLMSMGMFNVELTELVVKGGSFRLTVEEENVAPVQRSGR